MEPRKMKLDEYIKINAKHWNKKFVEKMSAKLILYFSDTNKKNRVKNKHLCRYCYYINTDRIGGAAITSVICANCDKKLTFPSTSVDILCDECAEKLKVCKHCGQKMD